MRERLDLDAQRLPVDLADVRVESLEVRDDVVGRAHREALRHVDELDQHVLVQQLREAGVEDDELAVVLHDHVAGVQVGVDEAVLEAHLEERHADGLGEPSARSASPRGSASTFVPRTNSMVRTRSPDSSAWTSGNDTRVAPAKFARNRV